MESFEEDYCERDAETIQNMLKWFCTSMTGEFDEGFFDHISARVRSYVSDGAAAALKTGRILKDKLFKNIAFFVRDPAHAVHIAGRDPLHADSKFGEFWRSVFDSKNALIRDVQFSDSMRARLEACQERIVAVAI